MSISTLGFSEIAQSVDNYRKQEESRLRDSETFGIDSRLREEFSEVWADCQNNNWDGQGALPVSRETLHHAYELLETLPLNLPGLPTISAEPDGHLTLEWYRSPRRMVSVSISPDGELHYAGLLGLNRTYGSEIVYGQWPSAILQIIKKVYS